MRTILSVAPRAGAWIETCSNRIVSQGMRSPLAQGRGLKQGQPARRVRARKVAPRAGAWIETTSLIYPLLRYYVAPRAGAWIETFVVILFSPPGPVAPRAGAWIETVFIVILNIL